MPRSFQDLDSRRIRLSARLTTRIPARWTFSDNWRLEAETKSSQLAIAECRRLTLANSSPVWE